MLLGSGPINLEIANGSSVGRNGHSDRPGKNPPLTQFGRGQQKPGSWRISDASDLGRASIIGDHLGGYTSAIWRRVIYHAHRRRWPMRLDDLHHSFAVRPGEVCSSSVKAFNQLTGTVRLNEPLDRSVLGKFAVGARYVDNNEHVVSVAQ